MNKTLILLICLSFSLISFTSGLNTCSLCKPPLIEEKVGNTKVCKSPCEEQDDFIYPDGNCLSDCSPPLQSTEINSFNFCQSPCRSSRFLKPDGTCVRKCASPSVPQTVNGMKVCVQGCPDGQYLDANLNCGPCSYPRKVQGSSCVNPCDAGEYLDVNGNCVTDCGPVYKNGEADGVLICQKPCDDGQYFNTDTSKCVDSCPDLEFSILDGQVALCSAVNKGNVIVGTVELDTTLDAFNAQGGQQLFINQLATALQISPSQIRMTDIRTGSVIVDYEVAPTTSDNLQTLASRLAAAISAGTLSNLGPVLSSSTVPVSAFTGDSPCAAGLYLDVNGSCVTNCGPVRVEMTTGNLQYCANPCLNGQFYREVTGACQLACRGTSIVLAVDGVSVCRYTHISVMLVYSNIPTDQTGDPNDVPQQAANILASKLNIDPSEIYVFTSEVDEGESADTHQVTVDRISLTADVTFDASPDNINLIKNIIVSGTLNIYGPVTSSLVQGFEGYVGDQEDYPHISVYLSYSNIPASAQAEPSSDIPSEAANILAGILQIDPSLILVYDQGGEGSQNSDGQDVVENLFFSLDVTLESTSENVGTIQDAIDNGDLDIYGPVTSFSISGFEGYQPPPDPVHIAVYLDYNNIPATTQAGSPSNAATTIANTIATDLQLDQSLVKITDVDVRRTQAVVQDLTIEVDIVLTATTDNVNSVQDIVNSNQLDIFGPVTSSNVYGYNDGRPSDDIYGHIQVMLSYDEIPSTDTDTPDTISTRIVNTFATNLNLNPSSIVVFQTNQDTRYDEDGNQVPVGWSFSVDITLDAVLDNISAVQSVIDSDNLDIYGPVTSSRVNGFDGYQPPVEEVPPHINVIINYSDDSQTGSPGDAATTVANTLASGLQIDPSLVTIYEIDAQRAQDATTQEITVPSLVLYADITVDATTANLNTLQSLYENGDLNAFGPVSQFRSNGFDGHDQYAHIDVSLTYNDIPEGDTDTQQDVASNIRAALVSSLGLDQNSVVVYGNSVTTNPDGTIIESLNIDVDLTMDSTLGNILNVQGVIESRNLDVYGPVTSSGVYGFQGANN